MDTVKKIAEVMAEHTGGDASEITAATTFAELGVDSLDVVEMVMRFEEELGIELELEDSLTTVGELASFIEGKMA